jgi:hypothetical protein
MNRSQFDSYIEAYNSGPLEALFRHYAPDLVFQSFGRPPLAGDAAFAFLREIHEDFEDRILPVNVLLGDDRIALEAILEMEARRDLPNFFGGAKTKGERSRMRILVWYQTVGDLISSVKLTGWPEA